MIAQLVFEQIAKEKKIDIRKNFTRILKNIEKFMFFCPFLAPVGLQFGFRFFKFFFSSLHLLPATVPGTGIS